MALLNQIDLAILKTLAYFNLFDLCLTEWEIYKFLFFQHPTTFQTVKNSLKKIKAHIDNDEGFYFLPGKNNLVQIRKQRYLLADYKYKLALKNTKLLKKIPYIKAIFICNNLAYFNSKETSDLDFFIITAKNHTWTARFWATFLMKILNRRPRPKQTKNKVCMSVFVDEDNLNFEKLAYQDDINFYYWIGQFVPLYDPENLYDTFFQKNLWLKNKLANIFPYNVNDTRKIIKKPLLQKLFLNITPSFVENFLHGFQLKLMSPKVLEKISANSTDVILNNNIIKMHLNDRRILFKELWQKKCHKVIPHFEVKDLINLIKTN